MLKMQGPELRFVAQDVALKVVIVAIVRVIGRPVLRAIPWMRSRGIRCIPLKVINQVHLVIISISLMTLC